MVYISHRLREVLEITDRVVCMRDGERVAELADRRGDAATSWSSCWPAPTTIDVGGAAAHRRPRSCCRSAGGVSFDLHAGEILGLAGLVGAGRTSVLRELFGVAARAAWSVDGRRAASGLHPIARATRCAPGSRWSPRSARRRG